TPDGTVMLTRPGGPLAQHWREQQRDEAEAWARQQRRNPSPVYGAGVLDEATYFARRAQRLARERARTTARNATEATTPPPEAGDASIDSSPAAAPAETDAAPHSDPAPRGRVTPAEASRWWERNKPTDSALEKAILRALHEHLDELLQPPPPF
ncbi:HNH endonuclease, partial [Dietzia sp. Marseille-Q0999]|nr:HNH endonuclease [Dietzia massiliensis]